MADKTCFIAMPVSTSKVHADLFGDPEHWKHVMESLFVPAVEAAGFEAWRPVARGSHMIHAEIVRQLEQADMVLCDLSQNNPNVFFELGVRTSVNKPIALVRCDSSEPIPFDVSGINAHTYNPSLKAWSIDTEVQALTGHLKDAEATCKGENPMWRQFGLTLKAQEPVSEASQQEALLTVLGSRLEALSAQIKEVRYDNFQDAWSSLAPVRNLDVQDRQEVVAFLHMLAHDARVEVVIRNKPETPIFVEVLSGTDEDAQLLKRQIRQMVNTPVELVIRDRRSGL